MEKLAFLARIEAKPGKEEAVESFLKDGLRLAEEEEEMIAWYAFRIGPSTFGIFDTFRNEAEREAHLSAKIAKALIGQTEELLQNLPVIEKVELLAVKERNNSHS
jgi:quinol monooxygenase YgiN